MSDDIFDTGNGFGEATGDSPATRRSTVTESLDSTFGHLCDSRRRYLLYYLLTVDETVVEVDAAANAIRQYEAAGTESDDPPSREDLRSELREDYLPDLKRAGVLDYDPRHGTIRFDGHPPLEEWVEHARHKEME